MSEEHTRIACLGWGSLIWKQEKLPVHSGWDEDGPELPVEFARQSKRDKKISLVICESSPRVRTFWALLNVVDMRAAKEALAEREGIRNANARTVGFWDAATGSAQGMENVAIADWAASRNLAGVVWTSLSCGFADRRGVMPRGEEIVSYLRTLEGTDLAVAREYVCKTRPQIDTPYRRLIEETLKWTYLP